jgi:ribosomal protein L19
MLSFFKKKNKNHIKHICLSKYLTNLKTIKTAKKKIINKTYIDKHIRKGEIINLQYLIYTNEINKFSLNGIVVRKNKKFNLNNSITVKSVISGNKVDFNFHLFSDGIRLL